MQWINTTFHIKLRIMIITSYMLEAMESQETCIQAGKSSSQMPLHSLTMHYNPDFETKPYFLTK